MRHLKLIACLAGVYFAIIVLILFALAAGTLGAHYINILLAKLGG